MNSFVDTIVKSKGAVYVLSPHFDDAIFSAGGLISELIQRKVHVTIINIFTKSSYPLTLSAKKYIHQCHENNAGTLFSKRESEDRSVWKFLGINPINLPYVDAVFRKIDRPNYALKILGRIASEFIHIYPTYALHVVRGKVSQHDKHIVNELSDFISTIGITSNDYLFAPFGIGNHVDHKIVRKATDSYVNKVQVYYWADYPYMTKTKLPNGFQLYIPNWKLKLKLMKMYITQYSAVVGQHQPRENEFFISGNDTLPIKKNNSILMIQRMKSFILQEYSRTLHFLKPRRLPNTHFSFLISRRQSRLHNPLPKRIILTSCFIMWLIILFAAIHGKPGNPNASELNLVTWTTSGPFELSPERGRFALTYSLLEDHSYYFSLPIAQFAIPDLGYIHGKYVSQFAPAVSYIAMPGYMIGKSLGISQVGAFSIIPIIAILNVVLLYGIMRKIGVGSIPALAAAAAFLFGSPAFAYAVTLYQHHISLFLILASVYLLLSPESLLSTGVIWFLCAMSIPVDYPNLFLMFPIGLYVLSTWGSISTLQSKTVIRITPIKLLTLLTVIIPLLFFMWFNKMSYGNPFQFSGTVPTASSIDEMGKPTTPKSFTVSDAEKYLNPETQHRSAVHFFQARNLVNGLYIHIFSPDRGFLLFTPIMLVAFLGGILLNKQNSRLLQLLLGIISADIILYSLWGDPWGGWAFGSRYLIPAYAIASILIGVAIQRYRRSIIIMILFSLLLMYSVGVNTLGAITSNANPPKTQVLALEQMSHKQEKYTFARNFDSILANNSKSFVFQVFFQRYITAMQFYVVLGSLILIPIISMLFYNTFYLKKYER